MKANPFLLFSTIALGVALLSPPAALAARIKCWTNDQGVRECGNVVPPKYSQKGHEEINRQGVTVGTQTRAKTQEELETERVRAEEEAARKAEEDRLARLQQAKDRVLLDTFTTEEDLVLAHQGRLAAIDSRIKHARQIVAVLEGDLANLQREAAKQERTGKTVAESLQQELHGVEEQIARNDAFITARHEEKRELEKQFLKDRDRYRELKSR